MDKPFGIDLSGVSVELGGIATFLDADNKATEDTMGYLEPWRIKNAHVSQTENYAVLEGSPENGVTVKVLEFLYRESKLQGLAPFSARNGIREFFSQNDIFVVFEKDGERRLYVVCHRRFPTTKIVWEAGPCRHLPNEKRQQQSEEQAAELDEATKQNLVTQQAGLDQPSARGNSRGKHREARAN